MKRLVTFIIIAISLSIVSYLLYIYVFHQAKATNHARPLEVPTSAVWRGDFDEGFWIELLSVDTSRKVYRFRIYNDYNGKLSYDGDFKLHPTCHLKDSTEIVNSILFFNSTENFELFMNDSCKLDALIPANGGSLWEARKGVHNK